MNSRAMKKNRFAERLQAVEEFGAEMEPTPGTGSEIEQSHEKSEPVSPPSLPPNTDTSGASKNKTIELRLETIATLKNAVAWQKVLGADPQTEKDIIEEALIEWFNHRGYPKSP